MIIHIYKIYMSIYEGSHVYKNAHASLYLGFIYIFSRPAWHGRRFGRGHIDAHRNNNPNTSMNHFAYRPFGTSTKSIIPIDTTHHLTLYTPRKRRSRQKCVSNNGKKKTTSNRTTTPRSSVHSSTYRLHRCLKIPQTENNFLHSLHALRPIIHFTPVRSSLPRAHARTHVARKSNFFRPLIQDVISRVPCPAKHIKIPARQRARPSPFLRPRRALVFFSPAWSRHTYRYEYTPRDAWIFREKSAANTGSPKVAPLCRGFSAKQRALESEYEIFCTFRLTERKRAARLYGMAFAGK